MHDIRDQHPAALFPLCASASARLDGLVAHRTRPLYATQYVLLFIGGLLLLPLPSILEGVGDLVKEKDQRHADSRHAKRVDDAHELLRYPTAPLEIQLHAPQAAPEEAPTGGHGFCLDDEEHEMLDMLPPLIFKPSLRHDAGDAGQQGEQEATTDQSRCLTPIHAMLPLFQRRELAEHVVADHKHDEKRRDERDCFILGFIDDVLRILDYRPVMRF
mmetsp:Transcript_56283/g.163207  ORF Transcript_56283/g.163207 Transcript_56283/m.163207 type:complete len:216 (-) Transcript_56283:1108-1755(-)